MPSRRSLTTVLFTDIVGSTERATELGDRAWRELQARHHRIIREELGRWCGREVTEAGDGFLALFDSPAQAIVCAHRVRDRVRELGLEIRAGLHMGQAERDPDGSVGGIAVHLGARVSGKAGPGEVLVTSAVRDAETGSGFAFEDLGHYELKGVDRPWQLFRVTALPDEGTMPAPGVWDRLRYRVGTRRAAAAAALAVLVAVAAYVSLRSSSSGEAIASDIRSLAVLPLDNLSGDPEQEYFAEGMTEALITELSKIGSLQVISRSSVMRYKESDRPLPEIAKELGVTGIVEGSVVRAGDRVRITAQLIHAGTDTHLWADSYDGDLADVLRLQSEVARAIAREIEVALTPAEAARLAASQPVDPEAYEAYLKGRFYWNQLTPRSIETALRYFHLALERDPEYALAYTGIAIVWGLRGHLGHVPGREAWPKARAAALRAIELDESLGEAHAFLGAVRFYYEWDWTGAERELRLAIELNPSYPEARIWYGELLAVTGREEEGQREMERALELDPHNALYQAFLGQHLLYRRRYDEAIAQLQRALQAEPDLPLARHLLIAAYQHKGMHAEELAERKKILIASGRRGTLEALERGFREGGYQEARRLAVEARVARPTEAYRDPIGVAGAYAAAGERNRALEWLERAYQERASRLVYLGVSPTWDSLRDDPRFQELLERLNLPQ